MSFLWERRIFLKTSVFRAQVRHPEILKRIDRVIKACEKKGVAFGMPISNPDWYQKGIRFLFAASDIDLIVNGGAKVVKDYKKVIPA